jgi:hypothetical protein
MVHTGAKTLLGGLKLGLFNLGYQSFTEDCVAVLAKKPMTKQMATEMEIWTSFFFNGCAFPLK